MPHHWSFRDPPDSLAITVRQIFCDGIWIYYAHYAQDGCWEFIGFEEPEENDMLIVSLEEIVVIDPSIVELADLPLGWYAWRDRPDQPWQRAEKFPDLDRYVKSFTIRRKAEKAKERVNLWSAPQYGLFTLIGIVTGGALLFSAFTTLRIDWYKGLFAVMFLALICWIVYGLNRMIKLPLQNSSNDADDLKNSDDCETNENSAK